MHLCRYYEKLCREIDGLIRKEADSMTASGERLLHVLLENKKHISPWLEGHEGHAVKEPGEHEKLLGDIADELASAEGYYALWESTGDATYKTMSKEEQKHAEYLIRAAGKKEGTVSEKARLQECVARHAALAKRG